VPDDRTPAASRRAAQARRAARLWGELTLGGIAVVGALTIWHLRRRARLLREGAPPPRRVDWPEPEPDAGDETTGRDA
jgi:hypothetical protein